MKVVVDKFQVVANATDSLRAHASDVRPIGHDEEYFYQCRGVLAKHLRRGGLDVVVVELEPRVDLFDARTFPGTQYGFVEMLQQHVVDFPQRQYVPVVVVHELLHGELRVGVAIAESSCQGALVVEQQPVLLASRDENAARNAP